MYNIICTFNIKHYLLPIPSVYIPHDQVSMQEDLNAISTWSETWNLSFNCSTSAILHFWQCHDNHTIYKPIVSKTVIKDLGVLITTDLSWADHIQHGNFQRL